MNSGTSVLVERVESNGEAEHGSRWDDPAASSDEKDLIERSRRDPQAVSQLYRRHHQAIARYIRRRVGCAHEADDLTAETFVAMVKHLPRYRWKGAPFRAWLYRLATTQVNRWARRQRRAAIRSLQESAEGSTNSTQKSGRRFDADQVRLALMSLPVRFQTVVSLHYMEGLSVSEIARTLGCSEGTVKSRLSRGRERMRVQLQKVERSHG